MSTRTKLFVIVAAVAVGAVPLVRAEPGTDLARSAPMPLDAPTTGVEPAATGGADAVAAPAATGTGPERATGVPSAPAAAWQPPPARYGMGRQEDVEAVMSDGTVLRADVYFPTDPSMGAPAAGRFPVILTQTPYGKNAGAFTPPAVGGAGVPYFVERGYLHVVADIRGSGASDGSWGLFDPVQASDGATLVRWAAALPQANGRVGLFGPSYLGIIQLLTAAAVGPDSPLDAIFPMVAANDAYRDVAATGGVFNLEFSAWFLSLTAALHLGNPVLAHGDDPTALLTSELGHLGGLLSFHAALAAEVAAGGDRAFDGPYWKARRPDTMLKRIVDNGIPAFLLGGWHDLLQRGAPLNYAGLQNAWAGRPVGAPMTASQPVTGRYQLMMGPWYHGQYGDGIDANRLALEWFERWLRDVPTGIDETSTPLHVNDLTTGRWFDTTAFPFVEAPSTPRYLSAGGALTATAPRRDGGADPLTYLPVTSPCNDLLDWSGAGVGDTLFDAFGLTYPCGADDRTLQVGPGALTYTTDAFTEPTVLAGPIGVRLWATATSTDALFVATVEDIAPDGTSRPLTHGVLLGSHRALDDARTWRGSDGRPTMPYHPFTRAASVPVTPGKLTRYDIEVFPTMATFAPGQRLRLTLTTGSTPAITPTPTQLMNLIGGVYQLQHHAAAASTISLPLAPATAFDDRCQICR